MVPPPLRAVSPAMILLWTSERNRLKSVGSLDAGVVGRHPLERLFLLRLGRLLVALTFALFGPNLAHNLARSRFIVAGAQDRMPEDGIDVGLQAVFGAA